MPLPDTERFELRQDAKLFPKTGWIYVLLLSLGYYWFVVHEEKGIFISGVLILLIWLLIRQQAASKCVLHADANTLRVESGNGLMGLNRYSMDFWWIDLAYYSCKSIELTDRKHKTGGPQSLDEVLIKRPNRMNDHELRMNWKNGSNTYFSGKDLTLFIQYLRTYFPEKELLPTTAA